MILMASLFPTFADGCSLVDKTVQLVERLGRECLDQGRPARSDFEWSRGGLRRTTNPTTPEFSTRAPTRTDMPGIY